MRKVVRQHPALRDDIADLMRRRPLPGTDLAQLDPFLFLNHHGPQVYPPRNGGLPFGPHPHRGFETVSFILAGEMAHLDSGGHESVIRAGGIQWMMAGSGLVHAEISPDSFKRAGGPLEILQLWINLPGRLKMAQPAYIGLQREDIPEIPVDRGVVNLIAGSFDGQEGPIKSLTGITMMTVALQAGGRASLPAPAGRQVFLYVVSGALSVNGIVVSSAQLVELDRDGDIVEVASDQPASFVFGHGAVIGEPVVSHGPFVMNTRDEIAEAIRDYQAGKFGNI